MESFKEIKDYYNGNFENLKDQIFRDLKIINQKSSYDDNFKLIENPFYWELMVNEKIINELKKFFQSEDIFFIPFTSLQYNSPAGFVHRDNKDREFNKGSDWNEEISKYKIARVAIYFSIKKNKIPFTIILNSDKKENFFNSIGWKFYNRFLQLSRKLFKAPHLQIPFFSLFNRHKKLLIESGNAIIFNSKLLHQGGVIDFNLPKIGIFFAYGVRNQHSRNQMEFLKNYKKKSNIKKKYWYTEEEYPKEFKTLLEKNKLLLQNKNV